MARNQIVINVDIGETRVALIENGIVTELHIERRGERNVVGDVYLGKVTRVLPGMNAAFVDIGLERAAFLHFEDIVAEGDLRAAVHHDDDEDDEETEANAAIAPPAETPNAELAAQAGDEGEDDSEGAESTGDPADAAS